MTSNLPTSPTPWRVAFACSEQEIEALAKEIGSQLQTGDRILLEGELGAGKTTFSRYLLKALKIQQAPEGSPTFALVHEYRSPLYEVAHIDFYRLRSEEEVDAAGIPTYFWERPMIVICEWLSCWPLFREKVFKSGRCWQIDLEIDSEDPQKRNVKVLV